MAEKIPGVKRMIFGADKNYDTQGVCAGNYEGCTSRRLSPRTTQTVRALSTPRRPVMRATRSASVNGNVWKSRLCWMKIIGMLKNPKLRGLEKVAGCSPLCEPLTN